MSKTFDFLFKLLLIGDSGVDKATLLRSFKDAFNTINILRNMQNNSMASDPRTLGLLLMNPAWMPPVLLGGYLYLALSLGPKLMAHRKPFNLRIVMLSYNFLQMIANACLAYFVPNATNLMLEQRVSFVCQPVNRSTSDIAMREVRLVHLFYLLKLVDLFDTVFFVLRKKQGHVSFLHVYHHTAMALGTFFYSRTYPGGHGGLVGIFNTYVHVLTYFYYFVAVYRPELTKNTGLGKITTIVQLVQFASLAFLFGRPALFGYECGIHKFWMWGTMLQAIFMFAMFLDFYVKAYGSRRTAK